MNTRSNIAIGISARYIIPGVVFLMLKNINLSKSFFTLIKVDMAIEKIVSHEF